MPCYVCQEKKYARLNIWPSSQILIGGLVMGTFCLILVSPFLFLLHVLEGQVRWRVRDKEGAFRLACCVVSYFILAYLS